MSEKEELIALCEKVATLDPERGMRFDDLLAFNRLSANLHDLAKLVLGLVRGENNESHNA